MHYGIKYSLVIGLRGRPTYCQFSQLVGWLVGHWALRNNYWMKIDRNGLKR